MRVALCGNVRQIAQIAEHIGRLHDDAGGVPVDLRGEILARENIGRERDRLVTGEARLGAHDIGIMGVQAARQHRLAALGDAMRHQHGFRAAGRAVVHGGIGDLHAGEQRDLRLEFEQILQRALRNFRLVGRVAGEKFRALDQMIDAGWHIMPVGARADEEGHAARGHVARGEFAQMAHDLRLRLAARQVERVFQEQRGRYIGEELVDMRYADARQHVLAVDVGVRQITHDLGP